MDLISRQAAIDSIESHIRTAEEPYVLTRSDEVMNHAFEIAASCVYNLPSSDAVEVVRCMDCKHSTAWYSNNRRCFLWSECGIRVFEDGFCNYGERKDG